jgi:hypothetical protein
MAPRTTFVGFKLTLAESAALERAAQQSGLSKSAVIRLALRKLLDGDGTIEVRILGALSADSRIPQP